MFLLLCSLTQQYLLTIYYKRFSELGNKNARINPSLETGAQILGMGKEEDTHTEPEYIINTCCAVSLRGLEVGSLNASMYHLITAYIPPPNCESETSLCVCVT